MRKRSFAALTLFAVLPAAACGFLFPLDGYTGGPTDAALDSSVAPEAEASAPSCGTRPPPRRPSTAPDVAGDVVLAFDTVDFANPDGPPKGYDLDGRCTVDEKSSLCRPPSQRQLIADLAGGIDSAGYPILDRKSVV